jgi:hypothetical protein
MDYRVTISQIRILQTVQALPLTAPPISLSLNNLLEIILPIILYYVYVRFVL